MQSDVLIAVSKSVINKSGVGNSSDAISERQPNQNYLIKIALLKNALILFITINTGNLLDIIIY